MKTTTKLEDTASSTPPADIIQPTSQQWQQSPSSPFYLELEQVYDLEEGIYKQYRVTTSPNGVVYSFAGNIPGPTYLYVTVNFLPNTSGIVIAKLTAPATPPAIPPAS